MCLDHCVVLSMSATNLARVKATLRKFSRAEAEQLLADVTRMEESRRVRATVEEFLRRGGIVVRQRA